MWDKARGNKKLLLPPDELPVRPAQSPAVVALADV
jgi:hypothetical protein